MFDADAVTDVLTSVVVPSLIAVGGRFDKAGNGKTVMVTMAFTQMGVGALSHTWYIKVVTPVNPVFGVNVIVPSGLTTITESSFPRNV